MRMTRLILAVARSIPGRASDSNPIQFNQFKGPVMPIAAFTACRITPSSVVLGKVSRTQTACRPLTLPRHRFDRCRGTVQDCLDRQLVDDAAGNRERRMPYEIKGRGVGDRSDGERETLFDGRVRRRRKVVNGIRHRRFQFFKEILCRKF